MSDAKITDAELDALVELTEEATSAFICGELDRYLELTPHVTGSRR